MRAVDQWQLIERNLPDEWDEATLSFVPEDSRELGAAAAVLGPLGAVRFGNEARVQIRQRGGSGGTAALSNLLRRLDRKRVWGTLNLVDLRVLEPIGEIAQPEVSGGPRQRLVEAWDVLVAKLPPDWSDLLCELEVDSSDYLARAALLGAPLNPTRVPGKLALRFRASESKGFGAPPGLLRRCLERLDGEGVTGTLTVVNALSQTDNVGTQGPVWRIAGRSV